MEEHEKEKLERSSSNVDAILEDVIKGGIEDKGTCLFDSFFLNLILVIIIILTSV